MAKRSEAIDVRKLSCIVEAGEFGIVMFRKENQTGNILAA